MLQSTIYIQSYFKVFSNDEDSAATSAEIKLLHYKCGYWEFPKVDCTKIVKTKFIFMGPCTPIETTKQGYKFKEEEESVKNTEILKIYKFSCIPF